MDDVQRICPALDGLIHGHCGYLMNSVALPGDRFGYVCPPECGGHRIGVEVADRIVSDHVARHRGGSAEDYPDTRAERRDHIARVVKRVDLSPLGDLSIQYKSD